VSEIVASSEPPADAGKRRQPRRRVLLSGKLVHSPSELTIDCPIQDISSAGARIRLPSDTPVGEPLYLINMSHGLAFRARIVWRRENRAGLAFTSYFDLHKTSEDAPRVLRRLWLEYIR
jgi:hypothetical protein